MATVIGSIGVTLLLLAFAMNLLRWVTERSAVYLGMNLLGASLAAVYAYAGGAIPFVILEGVWAAVALVRLVAPAKRKGLSP